MSVSFIWELKTDKRNSFRNGTSSDIKALDEMFPQREITSNDVKLLRGMHASTNYKESLWKDIADKLDAIQGEDYNKVVILKIDTEF